MARQAGRKQNEILIKEIQMGTKTSYEEIINYYKSLAEEIATNYFDLGVEKEDIISSSLEGLVLGVNKLATLGYTKNIYKTITRNINSTIEKNILAYYGIYLDTDKSHLKNRIMAVLIAKRDLKKTLKHNPTPKEISEHTKISEEEVEKILNFLFKHTNIEYSEFNSNNINFLELEQDTLNINIYEMLIENFLTEKEKKALYLIECKIPYKKICKLLNVSMPRTIELIKTARQKVKLLKSWIKKEDYESISNYLFSKKKIGELIQLFKKGNIEAYNYLYNYYINFFINSLMSEYTDYLSEEEISEIITEEVTNALKHGETYIRRIMKLNIIDSLERRKQRNKFIKKLN